jgi:hypothetical protein
VAASGVLLDQWKQQIKGEMYNELFRRRLIGPWATQST